MELSVPERSSRDVKAIEESIGQLDAGTTANLIATSADVALVMDRNGIIRTATFGNDDLSADDFSTWIGKPWIDTVTVESRPKVEALLESASKKAHPRWRQVNHPLQEGADFPVRYFALKVENGDKLIAIGRDLRTTAALQQNLLQAQHHMEREYSRLRQAETRYRLLFQVTDEAVLIVNALTQKIAEANQAASSLLKKPTKQLAGRSFPDLFDAPSKEAIRALTVGGRTDEIKVRTGDGGQEFVLSAPPFRQEKTTYLLARLAPVDKDKKSRITGAGSQSLQVIENMPEGFVVADENLRILTANGAFLEMAQLATKDQANGEQLYRFIGRAEVDLNLLVSNLRKNGAVRQFQTVLRGAFGSTEDITVSGVAILEGERPCFGFTLRPMVTDSMVIERGLSHSVEQLTKLVGRTSLKDIVRDTTDMIERLCIEAALELTKDNRASAAEMLGLSRQSLYSKLRRYGLAERSDI